VSSCLYEDLIWYAVTPFFTSLPSPITTQVSSSDEVQEIIHITNEELTFCIVLVKVISQAWQPLLAHLSPSVFRALGCKQQWLEVTPERAGDLERGDHLSGES
jgi:hypothetical protein